MGCLISSRHGEGVPWAVGFVNITFTLKKESPKLFCDYKHTEISLLLGPERGDSQWRRTPRCSGTLLPAGQRAGACGPGREGPEGHNAKAGGGGLRTRNTPLRRQRAGL